MKVTGLKVLVVEDEPEVAELIRESLAIAGCRCLHASDADEADRLLERHAVDAVTLDLYMPGRNGLEWLESIHRTRPALARRTLVVTGTLLDERARGRVVRCGAGLMSKPFSLKALVKEVRQRGSGSPTIAASD